MAAKTCLKTTGTIILLLVLVVTSAAVQADTIYVDVDASGNDDGTSWTDAFNYLRDALADAGSGDEIWVAEGTYYPDEGDGVTDDDRTETFQLVSNVGVYGGFDATETARSERDWVSNVTTLSGDIDKNGVLDDDNSYNVVTGASTATIDGFTVTKGYADGASSPYYHAGGMYNSSSPTITNCTFAGNYGTWGGGMANIGWSPSITNCTFSYNIAGSWGCGGGMYNKNSDATVTNCIFVANSAVMVGGGMDNLYSDVTVKNCLFFMNSLSSSGYGCKGGAMSNFSSAPEVTNCTFVGNVAGGDWFGYGGALNTLGDSPETVATNCIFWGNWAVDGGGEISTALYSNLTISYCDIEGGLDGPKVYNYLGESITDGGGNISTNPAFINIFDFSDITIAAGTTTTIEVTDASRYTVGDEIEYDNDGTPREVTARDTGTDTVTFANDALSSSSVMGKVIFNWGSGATDVDEDFHLDLDSPCIDVGDPSGDYSGQVDIDGEPREMGDCDEIVDIGVDEVYYPNCWNCDTQCYGDADCDGYVGAADDQALQDSWYEEYGDPDYNPCADFDRNGEVKGSDFLILKDNYETYPDPNCECGGTWPPN